jgi:superfamily II DNA or RNA helicase
MIVLHGHWSCEGRLWVWGEDSTLPAVTPPRRGRPPSRPRPRAHPFACAAPTLREALADREAGLVEGAEPAVEVETAAEVELALLLPSRRDGPAHSPQLLRSDHAAACAGAGELRPWLVPALAFDARAASDVLLRYVRIDAASVAVGDSMRWLSEVAKLALSLIARGRMLPVLGRGDGRWRACWQPVLSDPDDAERARLLAAAPPPLLRAEHTGPDARAPSGERLLEGALGAMLDARVRMLLERDLLGRPPRRRPRTRGTPPAVEAWIAALTDSDPAVEGDERELAALAEQLEAWRGELEHYRSHRGFRTCFRLWPPDEDAPAAPAAPDAPDTPTAPAAPAAPSTRQPNREGWRVEILMQSKEEPSMLISAQQVWSANGDGLQLLGRRLEDPQERLLGGLGHALRLWPELAGALQAQAPTEVELDAEGAARFVREAVPRLEQAGFGVLAPPWWRQRMRLKLAAEPVREWEQGSGLFGLDGLCDFEWRVAIGDVTLTASELRRLASMKLPLVMARGQWVVLRPEDVEAALRFFESHEERGRAPAGELLREGLALAPEREGALETEVEAQGWLGALLALDGDRERRLEQLSTPKAFRGELRPYQQRGLSWLAFLSSLGLGACLADDMGLGKTAQTLALLLAERELPDGGSGPRTAAANGAGARAANGARAVGGSGRRKRIPPTLLICPTSVLGNWQREAERFAPALRVHVHHGPERLRGARFAATARRHDLVITSYALAARDRDDLARVSWGRVALDEAQNIKTSDAKQTRAIRSLPAEHRLALTGTPVENRLSELHSIIDFLNPGLLGSAASFKRQYATPIERWRDERATELLRRATAPFILRRLKTDRSVISDLPEKIEMRVDCQLTREQATLYQAVVEEMLEKAERAEGIERQGVILSALMKLKQVCNHPAHLLKDRSELSGRSGKLARLEELLAEALAEGDRALCFTQFAEFGHRLRAHLQERLGREVLFLHGGTARAAREEMVSRFQSEDGPPLFVLSLKAGGTGLNLTAANHVIHFDRWWNPAVEDQATDRAFRIGQHKNVQVRKLTCVGTVEERIDRLIGEKKELAQRIVGSGENWITELDTARLRELVTLSSEAVEVAA